MGTVVDKLTYLNNTKQGLKNVINYTGAGIDSNTTFRDYEEKLYNGYLDILKDDGETLFNNLPKVTGEGTSVTLNDTANSKMKVELEPSELEQETTTGKNLAPINWASDFVNAVNNTNLADIVTKDSRDCLKYEPSAGYNDYDNKNLAIGLTFEENTQYTISFDMLKENTYNGTIAIYYTDETRTVVDGVNIGTWTHKKLTSDANKTIKYIAPYYTSGTTYIDLNTWQIEKGTNETTYEKPTNGASPNPDYPQEIHTISGDNEIVVGNINIWDEEWEVGSLNYSTGVKENDESRIRSKNYISVRPNTTYYLLGGNGSGRECFYDKNKNHISSASVYNKTFTTPNNAYYMMFTTAQGYGNTYKNDICINVSNENINGTYYSHQEQTLPLNLPVENLWNSNFERAEYDTSGNKVTTSVWLVNETKLNVKSNTVYTISQKETPSQYRIIYFNNNNYLSRKDTTQNTTIGYKNYTFTTPSNCNGVYIQFRSTLEKISQGTYDMFVNDITNTQLEENNKANSYTPYGTEPLEYCKIGDYEDEFVYNETDTSLELNKWYLKKNIGKHVFTGNETWSTSSYGINSWVMISSLSFDYIENKLQVMSNTFKGIPANERGQAGSNVIYTAGNNAIIIRNTSLETLAEVQNATKDNYMYITLATPTYILLNDTLQTQLNNIRDKVLAYQDQTNISQVNNDLPFRLKLSAIQKYTE